MATITQARQAMRIRAEGAGIVYAVGSPLPLRFQNEESDSLGNVALPDMPSPFAYLELNAERGDIASFGGGRGNNLYRNPARIEGFVFVPKGEGLDRAESLAEQLAALFRSYRDDAISCFDASVYAGGDGADLKPIGVANAVDLGRYFYAAFEVSLHFDQIG